MSKRNPATKRELLERIDELEAQTAAVVDYLTDPQLELASRIIGSLERLEIDRVGDVPLASWIPKRRSMPRGPCGAAPDPPPPDLMAPGTGTRRMNMQRTPAQPYIIPITRSPGGR